ncbi:MAG: DUF4118 domain-containing protein [Desulfobulbaceae bacterium]|nr:DUF4118 domain-containing protein [Desulfobulbaceae bacterium]
MMKKSKPYVLKMLVIVTLAATITMLHFFIRQNQYYDHIILRELYFLPILFGTFWFGVRGGIVTSLCISILYLPVVLMHWQGFAPDDLAKILEIILFNVVAVIMGVLRDREKRREHEKREAILALAGTVAHELNSPLQVVLGSPQLLQDDFEPESETYKELDNIINNIKIIRQLVKKISFLDQFILKQYEGETKIVDISTG